jgi:hypothetical protein|tara:strand:- start:193 stop:471 length:279 start_codon:yes stop_codon:yes gene_type:complete
MGIKRKITEAKNKLTRTQHMLWSCEDILYFSDMAMSYEQELKATEALEELGIEVKKYESLIASLEKQYTVIKVSLIATGLIICSINLYLFYG